MTKSIAECITEIQKDQRDLLSEFAKLSNLVTQYNKTYDSLTDKLTDLKENDETKDMKASNSDPIIKYITNKLKKTKEKILVSHEKKDTIKVKDNISKLNVSNKSKKLALDHLIQNKMTKIKTDDKKMKPLKSSSYNTRRIMTPEKKNVSNKDEDVEDSSYVVERIVQSRGNEGKKEYLIKWKGYDEQTWEPASNIKNDVPETVDAFEKNIRMKDDETSLSQISNDQEDEEDMIENVKLFDMRRNGNSKEYLIRQKNNENPVWETATYVKNKYPYLLQEFELTSNRKKPVITINQRNRHNKRDRTLKDKYTKSLNENSASKRKSLNNNTPKIKKKKKSKSKSSPEAYIIEKIVDVRQIPLIKSDLKNFDMENDKNNQNMKTEYLVKWENFDDSENTWEPSTTLMQDVPEMVSRFNKTRKFASETDKVKKSPDKKKTLSQADKDHLKTNNKQGDNNEKDAAEKNVQKKDKIKENNTVNADSKEKSEVVMSKQDVVIIDETDDVEESIIQVDTKDSTKILSLKDNDKSDDL